MDGRDLLSQVAFLKRLLNQAGCEVREEWLSGRGCALCEFRGRKVVFVDPSLTPQEQLQDLVGITRQLLYEVPAEGESA